MSYGQNASSLDEVWLWNVRYGHLSFQILSQLQKKSIVKGLPIINVQNHSCEICILAKQKRDIFPHVVTYKANAPIELVHTKLRGLMKTRPIGVSFHFLTFIDDFSRMNWIFC